jgi:transposase-like protein
LTGTTIGGWPSQHPDRRKPWTEADAQRVLDEWRRSGATLEAFARARGLVPQRIAWWRKRLEQQRPPTTAVLTLIPAAVIGGEPAAPLRLPSGAVLELASVSPSWVAGAIDGGQNRSHSRR